MELTFQADGAWCTPLDWHGWNAGVERDPRKIDLLSYVPSNPADGVSKKRV